MLPFASLCAVFLLGGSPASVAPTAAVDSASSLQKSDQKKDKKKDKAKDSKEKSDKDSNSSSDSASDSQKSSSSDVSRMTSWPVLENKAGVSKQVQRLVKARTEEMGKDAAKELGKIGAGAAPLLIKELGKARKKDQIKRIEATLEQITGAPHTRLLAAHFSDKKANVRRFALERASHFPDEGMRKLAEEAYATSQTKKSRWEPKDRYLAALCVAASGSTKSLDELIAVARKDWGKRLDDLSRTLPQLRSDAISEKLIKEIATEDRQATVDCLRLLSLCGTRKGLDYVKPMLDSGDASIRVAAINACRGIVTGEKPLGKLSAFEAIELAKEWKAKL